MRRVFQILIWTLLGLAFLLPSVLDAYVRSRVPGGRACLYWGTREIPWHLNEAGATGITDGSDMTAVVNSFETWNEPACSDISFQLKGLTNRRDVGYVEGAHNNINLVVFRDSLCSEVVPPDDPCWACVDSGGACCSSAYGCWEHAPGAIAITTTTFHRSTGLLVDADIELNEARYLFTTTDGPPCEDGPTTNTCTVDEECAPHQACMRGRCRTRGCAHTDIANTMTHEVGHVLGFDHTAEPEATMYASASLGETKKRELHEVDILGLCEVYPVDGPTLTCLGDVILMEPLEPVDANPNWMGCSAGRADGGLAAFLLILAVWPMRRLCRQGGFEPERAK